MEHLFLILIFEYSTGRGYALSLFNSTWLYGYKGKSTDGVRVFGDLIIWKEILRYAKDNRKPVLFVCDDVKEDWYKSVKNEKKREKSEEITPREELLREFSDVTGQKCWILPLGKFIKFLETNLTESSVLDLFEGLEQVLYVIEKKSKRNKGILSIWSFCDCLVVIAVATLRLTCPMLIFNGR